MKKQKNEIRPPFFPSVKVQKMEPNKKETKNSTNYFFRSKLNEKKNNTTKKMIKIIKIIEIVSNILCPSSKLERGLKAKCIWRQLAGTAPAPSGGQ